MTAILAALFSLALPSNSTPPSPALDCQWLELAHPGTGCTLEGGWKLVRQGQVSGDPGHYQFARGIAQAFADQPSQRTEATLLHGHALQQLHRFDDAYAQVAPLLASTPIAAVHQLLGDIRLEQGRILEAAEHYQHQLNLKPSPSAYARGAQVRYLSGDIDGAIDLLALTLEGAARSGDTAELAWVLRLGGRFLLSRGDVQAAIKMLADSAALLPNPSTRMLLAQSYFSAGDVDQSQQELVSLLAEYPAPAARAWLHELMPEPHPHKARTISATMDARGHARKLLVTDGNMAIAKQLLVDELAQRRDPITLSLAAWADLRGGDAGEAAIKIREALARPFPEPLPYLIGALVADEREHLEQRDAFLARVSEQLFLLSPVERALYVRITGSAS